MTRPDRNEYEALGHMAENSRIGHRADDEPEGDVAVVLGGLGVVGFVGLVVSLVWLAKWVLA